MRAVLELVDAAVQGDRAGVRSVEDEGRVGPGLSRADRQRTDDRERGNESFHAHPFEVKSRALPPSATSA